MLDRDKRIREEGGVVGWVGYFREGVREEGFLRGDIWVGVWIIRFSYIEGWGRNVLDRGNSEKGFLGGNRFRVLEE